MHIEKMIEFELQLFEDYEVKSSINNKVISIDIKHKKGNKSFFINITIDKNNFTYTEISNNWELGFSINDQLTAIQDMYNMVAVIYNSRFRLFEQLK